MIKTLLVGRADVDGDEVNRVVGTRLAWVYGSTMFLGAVVIAFLYRHGVETIADHVTPFYALYSSVFPSFAILGTVVSFFWLVYRVLWMCFLRREVSNKEIAWIAVESAAWTFLVVITVTFFVRDARTFDASVRGVFIFYWELIRWHIPPLLVLLLFLTVLGFAARKGRWGEKRPGLREAVLSVAVIWIFAIAFAASIAMIRGGEQGISQAYQRGALEYVGDIGKGSTVRGLFHDYIELQPTLSLHAKTHPPGFIATLWVLSSIVGRSPAALSWATIIVGTLYIFPFFFWVRELTDTETALLSTVLHSFVPAIVIFTATSADILSLPLVAATLFLFERALRKGSIIHGLAGGVSYGLASLMSFTLLSMGAYFAFAALLQLLNPEARRRVFKTAGFMIAGFFIIHGAVWLWSGFDVIALFKVASEELVDLHKMWDDRRLRPPMWIWFLVHPVCWFFYAGVPISILLILRLLIPTQISKSLILVFLASLAAMDLLFLTRGEVERAALYVVPFIVMPAGHLLTELCRSARSLTPATVTVVALAIQCWLMESYLYTYW